MRPGKYRHAFLIEQRSGSQGADGQPNGSWSTFLDCRGEVYTRTGSERMYRDVPLSEVSHVVTLWYQPGVTPAMRVHWGSRIFSIARVISDPRLRRMELGCLEQQ